MHTDITILSSAAISSALWVDSDVVQRAEVTPDTPDLLHEDLVVEPCLELSLSGTGCGDVHGGLATTQNHEVLDWCYCGAVERGISDIRLEDFKAICGKDLGKY